MGWQQQTRGIDPRITDCTRNLYLLFLNKVFDKPGDPPFALTTIESSKHRILLNFTPPTTRGQIGELLSRLQARYKRTVPCEFDAYLIDSIEAYGQKYNTPGVSRSYSVQDLFRRLNDGGVFNRTTYQNVPLFQVSREGTTLAGIDFLCEKALAKVHLMTDTASCSRKRTMRNAALRTALQYFSEHFGRKLQAYRIDAKQDGDDWDVYVMEYDTGKRVAHRKL